MPNLLDPYDRFGTALDPPAAPLYLGPVGSEHVSGDTSLTMPSPDISPLADPQGRMMFGKYATEADVARRQQLVNLLAGFAEGGLSIRAFHGSPHSFERFDTSKIGTGEGAQAYGHGLYFAENPGVAQDYRNKLSGNTWSWPTQKMGAAFADLPAPVQSNLEQLAFNAGKGPSELRATLASHVDQAQRKLDYLNEGGRLSSASETPELLQQTIDAGNKLLAMKGFGKAAPGSMYEVSLHADPEHFLDWDKPLSQQSQHVQDAVQRAAQQHLDTRPAGSRKLSLSEEIAAGGLADYSGSEAYTAAGGYRSGSDAAAASERLKAAGIPGIRYLDQGSRAAGEGTSNYVVFSPETIEILRRYGIAGLLGGGAAAGAASTQGEQQ